MDDVVVVNIHDPVHDLFREFVRLVPIEFNIVRPSTLQILSQVLAVTFVQHDVATQLESVTISPGLNDGYHVGVGTQFGEDCGLAHVLLGNRGEFHDARPSAVQAAFDLTFENVSMTTDDSSNVDGEIVAKSDHFCDTEREY